MVLAHVLSHSHHAKMFYVDDLIQNLKCFLPFSTAAKQTRELLVQIVHVLTVVKFQYTFRALSSTDNRADWLTLHSGCFWWKWHFWCMFRKDITFDEQSMFSAHPGSIAGMGYTVKDFEKVSEVASINNCIVVLSWSALLVNSQTQLASQAHKLSSGHWALCPLPSLRLQSSAGLTAISPASFAHFFTFAHLSATPTALRHACSPPTLALQPILDKL